ncbi:Holliday junction branch migration protein RuvA [Gammaproteobacteria bacterium]|nr:Holliday junction branch migration protein RuvA [Gammaproteobacteria bacterium]
MIGWLSGLIKHKNPLTQKAILAVNGVGYQVFLPSPVFDRLPELESPVELFIHHVVREDSQTLYGFSDADQCQLFESLMKSNGVGPRLALAILSQMTPQALLQCVMQQDKLRLSQIKGIGKKMAEKLLIDLKSLMNTPLTQSANPVACSLAFPEDALAALTALGYSTWQAQKVLGELSLDSKDPGDWIKAALVRLGPKQ